MKYVIKFKDGSYYSREQKEFSWSSVEDISEANVFYGTAEVEHVIKDGLETRQSQLMGGYMILEVTTSVSIDKTHESKTAADVRFMYKNADLIDAVKKLDPEELAKAVAMIMERARKTKKKFDDLQRVPHHKLTKPFTR